MKNIYHLEHSVFIKQNKETILSKVSKYNKNSKAVKLQ